MSQNEEVDRSGMLGLDARALLGPFSNFHPVQ